MPREYNDDGSYTDRYEENSGPVSVNHNTDGSVREQTTHESSKYKIQSGSFDRLGAGFRKGVVPPN